MINHDVPPKAGKNMCATIAMIHVIANKMESAVFSTSALGDADDEDDNGDDGDVHNNSDE